MVAGITVAWFAAVSLLTRWLFYDSWDRATSMALGSAGVLAGTQVGERWRRRRRRDRQERAA